MKDILEAASNEIVYQTSSGDDAANLSRADAKPFPLIGRLDLGNAEDFVRLFEGRGDFRKLRDWIRRKADLDFCQSAASFCRDRGVESPDIDLALGRLANGEMEAAVRSAMDVVNYGMDSGARAEFHRFYAARASLVVISVGKDGKIAISIGRDAECLAEARGPGREAMLKALASAFPVIAGMLPEKTAPKPKAARPR